jgi:AraC-like DNA-binding protein
MKEGQRLLIETEMTVSEIAYLLGYEQSSNFSTAFKKKFGISPLAVRGEQ